MSKKHKILFLSDHPLCTSGVGVQSRMLIEGLLKTGKYSFKCLGGAIKHENYNTIMVNPDFIIKPVDGFGTRESLRQLLITERPDAIIIFTDPRQFIWLWEMEDEIHQICPIAYWHVWDNDPYPKFNEIWYESTDLINCLSYKTYEMVKEHFPEKTHYIPHAFPNEIYRPLPKEMVKQIRMQHFGPRADWQIGLWVNRNATRKMPADVLQCFKEHLDNLEKEKGHRNSLLIMHTDPTDVEGPNLLAVTEMLGIQSNVWFSTQKLDFNDMNVLHNITDYVINISKAEGFGLCLGFNSMISTTCGYKRIGEINVEDAVFSSNGKYNKILAKSSRIEKNIIKIKAAGRPTIASSYEHPFMVKRKESFEWVEAKNLKYGDYLCIKKNNSLFDGNIKERLDILDYLPKVMKDKFNNNNKILSFKMGYSSKKNGMSITDIQKNLCISKHHAEGLRRSVLGLPIRKGWSMPKKFEELKNNLLKNTPDTAMNTSTVEVNRFIKFDEEFFKMFGWYLAKGSTTKNRNSLEFSLHQNEEIISKWLKDYFQRVFGVTGEIDVFNNKSRYVCSSSIIANLMGELAGLRAEEKRIHKDLIPLLKNPKFLGALMNGLISGDGYLPKKREISYITVSPLLAQQFEQLLMLANIYPRLFYKKNPNGKTAFNFRFTGKDYEKLSDLISVTKIKSKNSNTTIDQILFDPDFIYIPIKSIEKVEEEQELFDIQVKDSENFTANGVVAHNSTMISLKLGKPIIALKTGGMTRQVVDWRDGSEHGVAIEPAVRMLVGSQMVPYIHDDHADKKAVTKAFMKLYNMTEKEKEILAAKEIAYADFEFNFDNMIKKWDETLDNCITNWKKQKQQHWTLDSIEIKDKEILMPPRQDVNKMPTNNNAPTVAQLQSSNGKLLTNQQTTKNNQKITLPAIQQKPKINLDDIISVRKNGPKEKHGK